MFQRIHPFICPLVFALTGLVCGRAFGQASQGCQQAVQQLVQQCQNGVMGANQNVGQAAQGAGQAASGQGDTVGAAALSGVGSMSQSQMGAAGADCANYQQQCDQACSGPNDKQAKDQCDQRMGQMQGQANAAANSGGNAAAGANATGNATSANGGNSSTGGSSGGSGLSGLSSLLGPLMAAGMMAMMMNQQQQQQPQQQPPQMQAPSGYGDLSGTVKSDGTLNCGTNAAYAYSGCNQQLVQACGSNVNTMMTSAICQEFSDRYCNMGGYQPVIVASPVPGCPYPYVAGEVCGSAYFTSPSPTAATQVNIAGEGVGTTYCLHALQISFCAEAANAACPSCLMLNSLRGPACVSNPSACDVTSSGAMIQQQLANCPSPDTASLRARSDSHNRRDQLRRRNSVCNRRSFDNGSLSFTAGDFAGFSPGRGGPASDRIPPLGRPAGDCIPSRGSIPEIRT